MKNEKFLIYGKHAVFSALNNPKRKIDELLLIKENFNQLNGNKIISTGGGSPCFKNYLNIIQDTSDSLSIYLKANVNTLVERLKNSITKRPLIIHLNDDQELRDFITKHLFERSFYYEKSDIKIKTDDLELNEIVKLISELV